MQRRSFIKFAASVPALSLLTSTQANTLAGSPLIYVSPFKSNGELSSCQAEVWFVADGQDMYVVTAADAWRAQAVGQGLTRTQVWIGDVGLWHNADGKWRDLPAQLSEASIEQGAVQHARLLEIFGRKYADEWGTWGPRFKRGLADGSRVMLKYSPV